MVESFDFERIGVETGMSGVLHRLTLEYDVEEKDSPASVVSKHSSMDADRRTRSKPSNTVENMFYKNLVKDIGADVPRMHFSAMDDDTAECLLLLEDLGHLRSVGQTEDCSTEDALSVLRGISRIHAHFWSGGPGFDQIPDYLIDRSTSKISTENMERYLEPFVELTGDVLPEGIEGLARQVTPKLSEVIQMVYTPPITLIHGDLKLMNMFFDDSVADPPGVVLYDWQALMAAKASLDVSYFISTNFSTERRRMIEGELFDSYHQLLVDQGVKNYSLDEMMYDVRVAMLPRLAQRVITTVVSGEAMRSTEEGMANTRAMVESLQTLIDWNCDEVIPR